MNNEIKVKGKNNANGNCFFSLSLHQECHCPANSDITVMPTR